MHRQLRDWALRVLTDPMLRKLAFLSLSLALAVLFEIRLAVPIGDP